MIYLDTLHRNYLPALRMWRNQIKGVCREYRDISAYHQERWFDEYEKQAYEPFPKTLLWGIYHEDEDKKPALIGVGGWTYINWHTKRAELSYYLAPAMVGKGHGKAALKLLIDKAFKELGLHSVYGEVHAFNKASLACMNSCGFTQIGAYIDAGWNEVDGRYCDVVLLELVNAL